MCYSFLNFICEDISFQFEERTLDTLILSSHFVSVFCYILEERWFGLRFESKLLRFGIYSVCVVRVLISVSICVSFVRLALLGFMVILLQKLAYVFQLVCSVVLVLFSVTEVKVSWVDGLKLDCQWFSSCRRKEHSRERRLC